MNAIQIRDRIDFYNDLTRSARFYWTQYESAVNDAIKVFIDTQFDGSPKPYSFQLIDKIRRELYTLIASATPSISNGTVVVTKYGSFTPSHINFPADYYTFIELGCVIDGKMTSCKPGQYNSIRQAMENIIIMPTNEKPYYNEDATGLTVWRGPAGTFSSATLTYLKTPATFVLPLESQQILPGGTLTNALSYIATEVSVYAGTTYKSGATIAGTGATLTSGKVILATLTTTTDLPVQTHETLAKMASEIMLTSISSFQKAQATAGQVAKNNIV